MVIKHGLLAFLEIMHKIFSSMNLDTKKMELMNISHLENMDDFEDLLNAVESEIKEK